MNVRSAPAAGRATPAGDRHYRIIRQSGAGHGTSSGAGTPGKLAGQYHSGGPFLPASQLTLSQQIQQYHAGKDATLRVGDVVDRIVTVEARDALPGQIPPLLYAINGSESQRLAPVSEALKASAAIS